MNRIPHRRTGLRRALTASLAVGITLGVAASAQATFPGANGKIAYSINTGTLGNIHTANPDGSGATALTNDVETVNTDPEWSADGSRIVFQSAASGQLPDVQVMDADGGNRATVITNGQNPVWSPDGTKIAFIRNTTIWTANADGTGQTQLSAPANVVALSNSPDWSPDGTTITFVGTAAGVRSIFVVPVSTGVPTAIAGGDLASYNDPEWSADGSRIFYQRNDTGLATPASSDVWSVAPNGTGNVRLTTATGFDGNPMPSPDGTKVLYRGGAGTNGLFLMNPDGTGAVSSGSLPVSAIALDWQSTKAVEPPAVLPPVVSVTAEPLVQREATWEVLKSANLSTVGWDKKDSSVAVAYRVEVNRRLGAPVYPQVRTPIEIRNPNGVPIAVSISVSSVPGASCSSGSSPEVPAGSSLPVRMVCDFSSVPAGPVTLTATVNWSANSVAGTPVSATAPADFSAAQTVISGPRSVMVTDTLGGDSTRVLAEELSESRIFRYTRYMKASAKCRTFANTARLLPVVTQLEAQGTSEGPVFPVTPLVIDKDHASVRICPSAKDDPSPKDPPVVIVDNGDGTKPAPVPTTPVDNPAGPVITSPKATGKMVVTKRADTRRARVGDTVIWSITVRNAGKADLDDVVLTDRLPKHLRVIGDAKAPLAKGTKANSRLVKFGVGDLLVGQSVTVRVATRVVGKPALTPGLVAETATARDRNLQRTRAKRGITCNTVIASAVNARDRGAVSCIRITRPVTDQEPVIT